MYYILAFIAGALIGVTSMALFAASTLDRMDWQNQQLTRELNKQHSQEQP